MVWGECLEPVLDISKRLIFFRIFSDDFPNKWKDSWHGLSEMHAKNTSEVLKAFLRMFLNLQCKLFLMFFSFYAKMEQSCNNNQQIFWFSTLESISVKARPTPHLPRPVSIHLQLTGPMITIGPSPSPLRDARGVSSIYMSILRTLFLIPVK